MAGPWERFATSPVPASELPATTPTPDAPPALSPTPQDSDRVPTLPWVKFQVGEKDPLAGLRRHIDTVTGAPPEVRLMVGSAPDADKLANVRRFYPDAQTYITDPDITIINKMTGKPETA